MKITIDKKFLVIPVCYDQNKKTNLIFKNSSNGEVVFNLDVCLDPNETFTKYYVDFERFKGMTLETEGGPDGIVLETSDGDNTVFYSEPDRPKTHFSAKKGWINDPNGLIYHNGIYHLYFQHNPAGRMWGNMHWGHAESTDLIHWVEKDEAMFPDETGTMYSGSAILDEKNLTGLGTTENPPILFYYTAAGGENTLSQGKPYTQCLAYSTDNGKTLVKYDGNPVVPHIGYANRDPKVIWSDEMNCYYMALYLVDNEFLLYTSDDLLHWEKKQQINLPNVAECPDFYPLTVKETGERFWILVGAHDWYLVGKLNEEGMFCPVQECKRHHWGDSSYAAQSYSGTGDRRIKVAWNNFCIPNNYFNSSMNIPTEMTLVKDGDSYSLCANPIKEIESLYSGTKKIGGIKVAEGSAQTISTNKGAKDITFVIKGGKKYHIDFHGTTMSFDNNGCCMSAANCCLPSYPGEDGVKVRVIADTTGFEIFTGEGRAFAVAGFMANMDATDFTVVTEEGDIEIASFEATDLKSIW